jgi:hypothetical protein
VKYGTFEDSERKCILVLPKEIDPSPSDLKPHYRNGILGNVYLLALDNTKR